MKKLPFITDIPLLLFTMFDWLALGHFISVIGCFSSVSAEMVLVFLTYFIKREFGNFKYLLMSFAIVGAIFAIFEMMITPMLHSHNAGYMFFTVVKPFWASKDFMTLMLAIYAGFYAMTISVLAIQFIYRYWAVFNQHNLRFFKGPRSIVWFLYASFFGVAWAIGFYYLAAPDEYSEEYLRPAMLNYYKRNISDVAKLSVVVYKTDENEKLSIRWKNSIFILHMSFIMLTQYIIMIYCGLKMYYGMNEKICQESTSSIRLHKQIFRVLVLQISLPTFFLFAPVTLVIYLPFLNLTLSLPTGIWMCGFNLYPAVDAVIVMYIITDYRKMFRNLAHLICRRFTNYTENTSQSISTRINPIA